MEIKALSVRQPWAHMIVHHGKDIENRSRKLTRRGRTLIHASAGMSKAEYDDAFGFMIMRDVMLETGLDRDTLGRGGIIGIVDIVDCVPWADSPWFVGAYGLVLRNARALPFTPCRGTISPLFWTPPPEVMDQLEPHISSKSESRTAA